MGCLFSRDHEHPSDSNRVYNSAYTPPKCPETVHLYSQSQRYPNYLGIMTEPNTAFVQTTISNNLGNLRYPDYSGTMTEPKPSFVQTTMSNSEELRYPDYSGTMTELSKHQLAYSLQV